jgi:hypothetical protein
MAKPIPTDIPDDVKARFWSKVDVRDHDECWPWQGHLASNGYGRMSIGMLGAFAAQRLSLRIAGTDVPERMVVDHLCRNRACVNPAHLRVVTNKTNVLAGVGLTAQNATKTHCVNGHEFTPENTICVRRPDGPRRYCRQCSRVNKARSQKKARRLRQQGASK